MNPILEGHNDESGIVALHQKDESSVRLYLRDGSAIRWRDDSFYPFFFLSDRSLIDGFSSRLWLKELTGQAHYRYVCAFESWSVLWEAVRHILDHHNRSSLTKVASYTSIREILLPPDPLSQYLLQSGRTLYKGMQFEDLHRLQVDIETYTPVPGQFGRATRASDRIILVALSDNRGWEHLVDGKQLDEKELLLETTRLINQRDPDIIEGHNIYEFDLPYILKRCEIHGISFGIGRNGTPPTPPYFRGRDPATPTSFPVVELAGRQVIDTLVLVRAYDQMKHAMESHGLKYAAKFFGFAGPDRTYIPGDRISWHWDHDPEPLKRYAMDDVRETRALSDHLSGIYFYLTQMVPMTFSGALRSGSAAKIEHLLLREYLRRRQSIPKPSSGLQTTGGYTDIFAVGILAPVLHVDIESLYPSIMIRKDIRPESDALGIFSIMLRELTELRLHTKRLMNRTPESTERSRLDALQSSQKILINSFYGYLGYARGLFNDSARADEVTREGQSLLRQMIRSIRTSGGTVIEVDTDGIYFVPPQGLETEEEEKAFLRTIAAQMPEGITVALDGRFAKILSYKKKNYALLGHDGSIKIRGSSLSSRSIERFGREYVRQCIGFLLSGDIGGLHTAYMETRDRILEHRMDVRDFSRVESLGEPPALYLEAVEAGKRQRSAAYEVAIRLDRDFRRGSRVAYYITGDDPNPKGFKEARPISEWNPNFPDENTRYYLRRLSEFSEKFAPFFTPQDFRKLFSPDDLFPFSPEGIQIVTPELAEVDSSEEENFRGEDEQRDES